MEDRPKRLKARIFPYDDVDMDAMLADLTRAGFILRYVANGKAYIAIKPTSWAKHQYIRNNESESTIPPPDDGAVVYASMGRDEQLGQALRGNGDIEAPKGAIRSPGKERKGREGKETDRRSASTFDAFWLTYPKKKSRSTAERAWRKLAPSPELCQRILDAIAAQRMSPDWRKDDGRYIPYAATWLNGRRWEDEPDQPVRLVAVDWWEECQALHQGTCGGQMAHHNRKIIDAGKVSA